MTRRTLSVVAAVCLALAVGVSSGKIRTPSPGAAAAPDGATVERRVRFDRTVRDWQELYTDRGYLTVEQTLALKEERAAAAEAIAAGIAGGDAAVVADTLQRIRAAEGSREKLVLIAGLGRNPSPDAVNALEAVYGEAGHFRLKEESLRALGASEAEGHTDLLVETMGSPNAGLSQIAAMALYGEAEAVPALLVVAVDTDSDMNTRLEAVSSIGGVHTADGRAALEKLREDAALEARIRQYAERVLAREQL